MPSRRHTSQVRQHPSLRSSRPSSDTGLLPPPGPQPPRWQRCGGVCGAEQPGRRAGEGCRKNPGRRSEGEEGGLSGLPGPASPRLQDSAPPLGPPPPRGLPGDVVQSLSESRTRSPSEPRGPSRDPDTTLPCGLPGLVVQRRRRSKLGASGETRCPRESRAGPRRRAPPSPSLPAAAFLRATPLLPLLRGLKGPGVPGRAETAGGSLRGPCGAGRGRPGWRAPEVGALPGEPAPGAVGEGPSGGRVGRGRRGRGLRWEGLQGSPGRAAPSGVGGPGGRAAVGSVPGLGGSPDSSAPRPQPRWFPDGRRRGRPLCPGNPGDLSGAPSRPALPAVD